MQLDRLPAPSSAPRTVQRPARHFGRGVFAAALFGAVALAGAVTLIAAAPPAAAPAAPTGGSKVGVVNVAVVSSKIQELKAFGARIKDEQASMELSARGHQADLKLMQDKLSQIKPESDQFDDQLTAAQEKLAEFNKDDQLAKAKLLRMVNKQNKTLFLEIQQVVGDIAKRRGLDLVIVQPDVQLPVSVQGVDPQQLNNLISQKTVLYASPNIDLTDEVVTQLDANFKARGGVVPTPAPAK